MPDTEKSIAKLLKNIAVGLQKYKIEELNEAICKIIVKKENQKEEIDYVIKIVSDQFSITTRTLKTSRSRGEIQQARKLAYCLLHYSLGLSIRQIAVIFNRWHNSVAAALRQYKEHNPTKFRIDKDFENKFKLCQKNLLEHISNAQKL